VAFCERDGFGSAAHGVNADAALHEHTHEITAQQLVMLDVEHAIVVDVSALRSGDGAQILLHGKLPRVSN
jgi:hypothetical protein